MTKLIKQTKNQFEPIKITEPFNCETIVFDTAEDFTKYYRNHQEELDKLTSMKLNKAFKINGYHIKRPKPIDGVTQELELIKDYYKGVKGGTSNEVITVTALEEITKVCAQLNNRITAVEEYLKGVIV